MFILKFITKISVSIIVGFGFWYVIFFFLTVEPNPLNWHWATKIIYLLLAFSSAQGTSKALLEE